MKGGEALLMIEPHAASEIEKMTRLMIRKWHSEISNRLKNQLSLAQYHVLEALRDQERNCSNLAELMQITLPAVTNLATKLVASGLAERVTAPKDRRVVLLRITAAGHEALQELDEQAGLLVQEMWAPLNEDELKEMSRLIRKSLQLPALPAAADEAR